MIKMDRKQGEITAGGLLQNQMVDEKTGFKGKEAAEVSLTVSLVIMVSEFPGKEE